MDEGDPRVAKSEKARGSSSHETADNWRGMLFANAVQVPGKPQQNGFQIGDACVSEAIVVNRKIRR